MAPTGALAQVAAATTATTRRFAALPRPARILIPLAVAFLVASPLLIVTASAITQQTHQLSWGGCTTAHFTEVDNPSGGAGAYAKSKSTDWTSGPRCTSGVYAKAEWCKDYYCENTGILGTSSWTITATKQRPCCYTIDIGRGWSWHSVGLPPNNLSPFDASGDLPP